MDYGKFLTKATKRRGYSKLRQLGKYIGNNSVVSLAGGIPTPRIFCFNGATFSFNDGSKLEIDEESMVIAQQYGTSNGYAPLREIMSNFQSRLHSPPNDIWTTMVTSGCQESLHTVFEMILEEGDYLIGGEYVYSGAVEIVRPKELKYLAVEGDEHGMRPDSLLKVLSRWTPEFCRNNKKESPKMIYFVPNGGNPESFTMSAKRRKEIYKIAQLYDLIILEDDPYQFLVYDKETPPSLLSLDTDGRVLRCDTYSKIIAPGFRIGSLTGAEPFLDAALKIIQVSSQQPSCLSQVLLYKLFLKWGFDGYVENALRARDVFLQQKNIAEISARKWLAGLAEIPHVSGGFFLWIELKGVEDSAEICTKCLERKVLFAPGKWFKYDESASPHIRVSFSSATKEEFDDGFRILAELLQEQTSAVDHHPITNGTCH